MSLRETVKIRLWALAKVPMIGYVRPQIVRADAARVDVRIPLRRRTKNHWGTMYFGALAVGADLAAGLHAMLAIEAAKASGTSIGFVFKDVQGEFLRRPDADVVFSSQQGDEVAAAVANAAASGERVNVPVHIACSAGGHNVANFTLTLSLKRK